MQFLYSTLISVFKTALPVSTLFSSKMKQFVNGRKTVYKTLKSQLSPSDKTIWFHCASLGEYEQGFPVMEAVKKQFPEYKVVITFFSPSGFEHKKNSSVGDVTVYLPLDTKRNVNRFLSVVNPSLVLFVKYEFWPNYLLALQDREIPVFLISALFRKKQVFFKHHGFWMRKILNSFTHIFVQDKQSKQLLESISIKQVSISGDTRYDRVSKQIEENNHLDFIKGFLQNNLCLVAGSTWPEDEDLLLKYINQSPENIRFIIAPHNLKSHQIESFQKQLTVANVCYTELLKENKENHKVLILDTIGHLKKVYSYADIAYVGGAMGTTGLHNVLEAATFGVPIVIGKNYEAFPEALALQSRAGLFSVSNKEEFLSVVEKLVNNTSFREKAGMINGHYVQNNTGATQVILDKLKTVNL